MVADAAQLEAQMRFLRQEVHDLRMRHPNQYWADRKALRFESIAQVLEDLRLDR